MKKLQAEKKSKTLNQKELQVQEQTMKPNQKEICLPENKKFEAVVNEAIKETHHRRCGWTSCKSQEIKGEWHA